MSVGWPERQGKEGRALEVDFVAGPILDELLDDGRGQRGVGRPAEVERETVELPPALTVVFQLGLGTLVGGLGLVLATPLLAMIVVVVQLVYLQDILGDEGDTIANIDEASNTEAALS